jgi:hypothetical protein
MGRRVISSARQSTGGESVDSFAARVVKYIPADVVAAWVTVSSLITSPLTTGGATATTQTAQDNTILWVLFFVFVLLTAIWTWRTTLDPQTNAPVAKTQILVSTISFIVWVFGLGGPFTSIPLVRQKPALGGVALIIWTLIAGMIVPPKKESQPPSTP